MGKEGKSEIMGRVYREFSRQKYNKYKAQFPKLRESELVSKIIKEWDALDQVAKDNLQKTYERKNYLTNEDISSSEALVKAELAQKEGRFTAERSGKKSIKTSRFEATKIHSNVKAASVEGSEVRGSEQKDDSRLGESSSLQIITKTKTIAKPTTKNDYIDFFKYYYKKLSSEHRRWSTPQITKVIKLLWKKTKKEGKSLKRKDGRLRTLKPITGRRFFRKTRRLSAFEAKLLWRQLPYESKQVWDREAKGIEVHYSKKIESVKYGSSAVGPHSTNSISHLLATIH